MQRGPDVRESNVTELPSGVSGIHGARKRENTEPAPKGLTSWMLCFEAGVMVELFGISLGSVPSTSVPSLACVPQVKECSGQFPLHFSFTSLQVVNEIFPLSGPKIL